MARVTLYILCLGSHKTHAEYLLRVTHATLSFRNCESDVLHFIFLAETGLRQSTDYVDSTRNSNSKNGESDALHFMIWVHTGLGQSTRYVEPSRNSP